MQPLAACCETAQRLGLRPRDRDRALARGARLMTTLLSVLEQNGGRYGLQTMCEAGGIANATFIERL